ncbi:cyclic AMP-dependent transcription factor ATF-1 isoform X1 [Scophthalmus maximus]|nr:cyclic AMP-dependent transcription factor ATF-1 isoform X1 [Scophthalmus maximus]
MSSPMTSRIKESKVNLSEQPLSLPVRMKEEETCQPVPPVTSIPLHPQWFASQQNDPSLPFMAMAGPQTQQPLPGTSQYYSVVQNRMQHYGMPTLQGRPVQFQPDGTHNILLQTPHPTTSTTENRRDRLDQPQMNSKQTLSGSAGDFTAYQQHKASSSLPHGGAGAIAHSSKKPGEVVSHKRELRLQKNREAARECRRKKKEYVKCLENRVAVLENQNKTLIEELRALKDIYQHKAE